MGVIAVLGRLGLAVASLALVLILLEVSARVAAPSAATRKATDVRGLPPLSAGDLDRANVEGLYRGTHYRTNSATLRGPDHERHPEHGVFRILIGGDSVTAGAGVDEAETYATRLEALLNADDALLLAAGATRFEVLNAGRPGLNAAWVIRRIEGASRPYRFHLAIYGWTYNDLEGLPGYQPVGRDARRRYWAQIQETLGSPSFLVRAVGRYWVDLSNRMSGSPFDPFEETLFNHRENPKTFAEFEASLDRFARFVGRQGICGHVFVHTQLAELDEGHALLPVYEQVATAARDHGLSASESFQVFDGRRAADLWVSLLDSHPNAEGHALLADALHRGLRDELPRACWRHLPRRQ